MGADSAVNQVVATVLEELPSALYRVELENKQRVLAHAAGSQERNFVRLLPGDQVRVELFSHDRTRGRITRKVTEPLTERGSEQIPGDEGGRDEYESARISKKNLR
jgi:translation initiation factor IF-1